MGKFLEYTEEINKHLLNCTQSGNILGVRADAPQKYHCIDTALRSNMYNNVFETL